MLAGVRWIALATVILGTVSSASSMPQGVYMPEELRALWRETLPPQLAGALEVPFAANEDIVAAARQTAGALRSDGQKLEALTEAILSGEGELVIRYAEAVSGSAQETFARREGNCGALANLFVAMARAVGLRARFVDASRQVNSVSYTGTHVVQRGHLTAGAWTEAGFRTIDFDPNGAPLKAIRILDDREAVAHHYNNRGYELLAQDRAAGRSVGDETLTSFELALAVWPGFARTHNNLGVALAWANDRDGAAEHYRAAIAADPDMGAPHSNLADLMAAPGELLNAVEHYREARRLGPDNASPWLKEGLVQQRLGRLAEAKELLRGAVARAPKEPRAWIALIQLEIRLEETSQTIRLLEEFLTHWPESQWARLHLERLRGGGRQPEHEASVGETWCGSPWDFPCRPAPK